MPPVVSDTGRTSRAYCVPEVTVVGVAKFAVSVVAAPLVVPATVVDARSAPVGNPPLVALIDTVKFTVVVQPEQNTW